MYVLIFKNLSIYDHYMYYYWPIHQIFRLSNFLEVFDFFVNHYVSSDRTCPVPNPDISNLPDISGSQPGHVRPSGYKGIKEDIIPLGTLALYLRLHSTSCASKALPRQFGSSSTESL
jgi:hypothetical protein